MRGRSRRRSRIDGFVDLRIQRAKSLALEGLELWSSGGDPAGSFEEAIREYTAAIDARPRDKDVLCLRGAAARMRGRLEVDRGGNPMPWYRQALEDQEAAVATGSAEALQERAAIRRMMAAFVRRQGEDPRPLLRAAGEDLEALLARFPRHPGGLYERGNLQALMGDVAREGGSDPVPLYERATADLEKLLETGHCRADCLCDLGRIELSWSHALGERGEDALPLVREALRHLEEAARLRPGDPEVATALGQALLIASRQEQPGEDPDPRRIEIARGWFDRALDSKAGYVRAFLARAFAETGSVPARHVEDRAFARDKALADVDRALLKSPEDPQVLYTRGWLRCSTLGGIEEDFEEQAALALADLDRTLAINPQHAEALSARGMVRMALAERRAGRGEGSAEPLRKALADFDEALLWNPADACTYLQRGMARFDLARVLWGEGSPDVSAQLEGAAADCEEALRRNPRAPARELRGLAVVPLALLALDRGDREPGLLREALACIVRMRARSPADAQLDVAAGRIEEALGNLRGAIEAYTAALSHGADTIDLRLRLGELEARLDGA